MGRIRIDSLRPIRIARLADAEVDHVVFDISPWREAYPALTNYRVEVTSPDGIVYIPVKVALGGDNLTWTITAEDTTSAGDGLYQIVAAGACGEHKTSAFAAFTVRATMPGTAEDTPPDPAKPWVDKVVEAAQRVEDAIVHPPIIGENGNWWLWDFGAAAYVDSGKPSQGSGSGGGGITKETDPTVPTWAKQPNPPTYTAADVGAQPAGDYALKSEIPAVPAQSVNGKTGNVKLNAEDVGAASSEDVARLNEEIANKGGAREKPLVYIDGAIPTTKDNVLATMTVKSKWLNIFAYIKIKCQGSSSMSYPKKNFTVTLYQDAARTIPLKITIPGWKHASNKFVLKANYIDHLHARNIITARLWSEVVESRPDYDTLPEEFRNSPNNGAVDGFPIIVYANGAYQGIYTWNIGKDAWLWGMDEDNPNHVLMCGETNTDGVYAETPCNFRALWSGVNEDYWSVEVGESSDAVKTALNNLIGFVMNATDEEFVAQIETYLDVQSAIDYYLFSCANCGIDNLGKNMLLGKYESQKWMLGQYDLDSTWGLWWNGSKFIASNTVCPDGYQEKYSLLFERVVDLFKPRLVSRGYELRNTVLSIANINAHFERYAAEIGAEAYADDLVPYPSIPSAETNNIWQIRNFVKERLAYFDVWLNNMVEVDYDTPYPLNDGVYTYGQDSIMTMIITNGNHVRITSRYKELCAGLMTGEISSGYDAFAADGALFTLSAGDVVRRELRNIVASGDDISAAQMALNLYGPNGEIKLATSNLHLNNVASEVTSEVNISEGCTVNNVIVWAKNGNTDNINWSFEFDLFLYVNDERYI